MEASMRIASIAASGLRAAEQRLEVSAGNVANVSTEGYVPARSIDRSEPGGGVSSHVERPELASLGRVESGTDIAQESVQQILAKNAFSANLAVLRTADEVSEELVRRRG